MSGGDAGGPLPGSSLPLLGRAAAHGDRVAVADGDGEHRYDELLAASAGVARALRDAAGAAGGTGGGEGEGLLGRPVAFMVPPGAGYVSVLAGIWRAGGIAVPLCLSHPPRELAYVLDDTGAGPVVGHPAFRDRLRPLARERDAAYVSTADLPTPASAGAPPAPGAEVEGGAGESAADLPGGDGPVERSGEDRAPLRSPDRPALIMYTSGTTGRPKGVLHTHRSLEAQIRSLIEAWAWRPGDRILHTLPLHHTHGIVNALLCALWSGAACEMTRGFDPREAWERIASGRLTLFMGVPTMYVKLIRAWKEAGEERQRELSRRAGEMRLAVSGSAALPVPVFEAWAEIAGEPPLERYGMTEIGMGLSNPLRGERRPGHVGRPLPRVDVRLVDEGGEPVEEGSPGEIEVRGPTLFREYWEMPETTREALRDGWFRTGDEAVVEGGDYRILGRKSVDIINTGGYKVSALEVEEVLLRHPAVEECAVVGVPDPEWGERVCAAVVPAGDAVPELEPLRAWGKERLAPYKVPTRLRVVDALPRNPVGKVTKPDLEELFGD